MATAARPPTASAAASAAGVAPARILDLGTVRAKLDGDAAGGRGGGGGGGRLRRGDGSKVGAYRSLAHFAKDVRLMFDNPIAFFLKQQREAAALVVGARGGHRPFQAASL